MPFGPNRSKSSAGQSFFNRRGFSLRMHSQWFCYAPAIFNMVVSKYRICNYYDRYLPVVIVLVLVGLGQSTRRLHTHSFTFSFILLVLVQ